MTNERAFSVVTRNPYEQYSICLILYLAVCGHILPSLKVSRVPLSFHAIRIQQTTCPTCKYRPLTNMNSGLNSPYQGHSKVVRLYGVPQENIFLMRFINAILVHINRNFLFQRAAPICQPAAQIYFYLNTIKYFNYFCIVWKPKNWAFIKKGSCENSYLVKRLPLTWRLSSPLLHRGIQKVSICFQQIPIAL